MRFSRSFVPDLSPMDRAELRGMNVRVVFVAESPHSSEIASETIEGRRPLCGASGRKWWSLLREVAGDQPSEDVSLPSLLRFCRKHGVVVLNSVQWPLDRALAKGSPALDPLKTVGFCKNPGPFFYKRLKSRVPVKKAVRDLARRLQDRRLMGASIYCLGGDAEWFVRQAMGRDSARVAGKIPHPSAWRRNRGLLAGMAEDCLRAFFKSR